MKTEFKDLSKRISELTQQSQKASKRSLIFAIRAQLQAEKARAHLHLYFIS